MADLFSEEWMKGYMEQWNAEPELADALAKINFNSVIGYGFDGEDTPRGVIKIENGRATSAGTYNGVETTGYDGAGHGLYIAQAEVRGRRLWCHDQGSAHGWPVHQEFRGDGSCGMSRSR
jgi:hypothetical protein